MDKASIFARVAGGFAVVAAVCVFASYAVPMGAIWLYGVVQLISKGMPL